VWQIASATGWSVDYILDGVNYQTLIMMLSDAPRYVRKKQGGGNGARVLRAETVLPDRNTAPRMKRTI